MNSKFPTRSSLFCLNSIFNSHDDFTSVEALYSGFDEDFNIVILCDHTDYDDPESNCSTCAVVSRDEAYILAKKYGVALRELPNSIGISDDWHEIICPTPGDVRRCFKEITADLMKAGCHLRIIRKAGANGFISL